MAIQVFGTKKCRETQKATRFLKERGAQFHFIDLNEKKLSKGELESIKRFVPLENLIDKDSKEYKNKNLQYMSFDLFETLLANPLLLKTPIVRSPKKAFAGYDEKELKGILSEQ